MSFSALYRFGSLIYGIISLLTFSCAIFFMIYSLYYGMETNVGILHSTVSPFITNIILLVQFPLIHSLLLTQNGKKLMGALNAKVGKILAPTTYVLIASIQLLITFLLWTPSHHLYWSPQGSLLLIHQTLFIASWLLLLKSMYDAHLGIQLGYIGWLTVLKNKNSIAWPPLPTKGMFKICRQPIYFSFMLTLWTGPIWSRDKLIIGTIWSFYSLFGPLYKELRFNRIYGTAFQEYKKQVPFWPTITSILNLFSKKRPFIKA